MRFIATLFLGLMLLTGGPKAQETDSGWLGVDTRDITKEEADALGWEAPRGAKVTKQEEGSPAARELAAGDIVLSVDKLEIDGKADFDAAMGSKRPGVVVKLRLLRDGREKTISATLAARSEAPKTAEVGPLPVLDTGGHMALIRGIAFTPDGRQLVSASEDKTIRVWDLATGKTVRTIRGESTAGDPGKIYAMALSSDGKWLAAGGTFTGDSRKDRTAIRLYDFPSGRMVALLKGHKNVVHGLAFSPDSTKLISGSADRTAIIWDVAARKPLQPPLNGHTAQIYAVGFTPDGARAVTGSGDHDLRLWRVADGGAITKMQGHTDKVRSLAVASDGIIASGDLIPRSRRRMGDVDAARVLCRLRPWRRDDRLADQSWPGQ